MTVPPTPGARHLVLITLDSCRFDSFVAARPRHMARLGEVQRRYSYATWTAPSHYNLMMGLMPHSSPRHVFASEAYKGEFRSWGQRLGLPDLTWSEMVPQMVLPEYLRAQHGYHTQGLVSLPVINRHTPVAIGFDRYELMPRHNDMAAMLPRLVFDDDRPTFALLNAGETHYPYATPDEPEEQWPQLHGLHGVFRTLDDGPVEGRHCTRVEAPAFFDEERLGALRSRQVDAVRHLDGVVAQLFDLVPPGTWITITSDHGELFGEDGYFGHGPILHDKVLEVPFVEGLLR